MALADAYVQVYGQLPEIFRKLAEGQAPDKFTIQHLKDIGLTSANHRAIIPLLKAIGFLSNEGVPTQRYHDYRNQALSRRVMAQALREAYSDLFVIKANPSDSDRPLIEGKFKSTFNTTDRMAKLMANTFFSMMSLADLSSSGTTVSPPSPTKDEEEAVSGSDKLGEAKPGRAAGAPGLYYNIQIHLPPTKDIEVYNAIFKSLKEHLLD